VHQVLLAVLPDPNSPARIAQIDTITPILHHDGSNLAAALQTVTEIRPDDALATTLEDAFPKSRLYVENRNGRFEVQLEAHGLLRPLSAAELFDGMLRSLRWTAALLTPRPPEFLTLSSS
jgi:predicted ATPase